MSVKGMIHKELKHSLRCMGTKGNNFCDFLFAYLDDVVFPKLGLFLKPVVNLLLEKEFLPLKVNLH